MQKNNREFVVYQNKAKSILYILLAMFIGALSLALFVYLLVTPLESIKTSTNRRDRNFIIEFLIKNNFTLPLKILFLMGFFICVLCIFFCAKRIITNRKVFIISDKGITDNTSMTSFGFINWKEIEDAFIYNFRVRSHTENFIVLKIRNEEEFLDKQFPLKKLIFKINRSFFKHMIFLNFRLTNYTNDEILEQIKKYQPK